MAALVGRLTGVRGDTLLLQVESMQRQGGRSETWNRSAPTVAVLPAAGDRVEVRRLDRRKTAVAVLVTAASLVAATFVGLLIGLATEGNT